jgi:hypothetical protein
MLGSVLSLDSFPKLENYVKKTSAIIRLILMSQINQHEDSDRFRNRPLILDLSRLSWIGTVPICPRH